MPTSDTNLEDHNSTWRSEIEHLTCQPLRMISVHLTDHCNSKCQFCVINSPLLQTPILTEDLVEFVSSFAREDVDYRPTWRQFNLGPAECDSGGGTMVGAA